MNEKESSIIYILKSLAIFSVVCAHTAVMPESISSGSVNLVVFLLSVMGTIGVPTFFVLSGYLFFESKRTFGEMLIEKLKTIVIPWIFCETLVWLYVVLRKGGITIKNWLLWIVGYKHSTYYLTVLILLFLLFYKLRKSNTCIFGGMILSLIAVLGLGWEWTYFDVINKITGTYYLNIFNWMGYFCIGMITRKYNLLNGIIVFSKKVLPISSSLLVIDIFIHFKLAISWTYFSKYTCINTMIFLLALVGISECLCDGKRARVFKEVGRYSFTIYLLHELVVGTINYVTSWDAIGIIILVRPIIVIGLVMVGVWLVKLDKKADWKWYRIFKLLVGIR